MNHPQNRRDETLLFWLLAATVVIRLLLIPFYPLFDPSESRYAVIAMKMAQSGDWITPTIDGTTPFWGKPPLSFWLSALSYRMFGIGLVASRLPAFLCYVSSITLVACLGRDMRGRHFALLAACIFASMALPYVLAGQVLTDSALAVTTTAAMAAFWFAMTRRSRIAGYFVFVSFALALLSKGPIGALLPGGAMVGWALWEKRAGDLFQLLPLAGGTILCAVIALPWYLLAEMKTPGFIDYFIVGEHFRRYLDPHWDGDLYGHGRPTPIGMIWLYVLIAMTPWWLFAVAPAWRRLHDREILADIRQRSFVRFLTCWALMPLVFFTFARNTLITYVLPVMPAVALLVACGLVWLRLDRKMAQLVATAAIVTLLGGGLTVGILVAPQSAWIKSQQQVVALWRGMDGSGDDRLTYLGDKPFSADFYSAGRARQVPLNEPAPMLDNDGARFFAVEEGYLHLLPQEFLQRLIEVGRSNATILFERKAEP